MNYARPSHADDQRPVFLGGAEYMAPTSFLLEEGLNDHKLCARLRCQSTGLDRVPIWEADITDLVAPAMRKCLASSARQSEDVDAVLLVSNTLDAGNNLDPTWLAGLDAVFGGRQVNYYHVGMAGCAGFGWAARLASSLIVSGFCRNVLIASFDKGSGRLQRVYAESTDFPYVTGDAAACCLLSGTSVGLDFRLVGDVVNVSDISQTVSPTFEGQIPCIVKLFKALYESARLTPEEIDLMITNNYSVNVSRLYGELAGVDRGKVFVDTMSTHAHCFSSDSIIGLHQAQHVKRIRDGDRVLVFSTGMFQWSACVLQKISGAEASGGN